METIQLLGSTLGLGLVAGIRLYTTVLAIGLGIRWGILQLPAGLSHLNVLADTRVLAAAGVVYAVEFVADKVPWVDSLWDSFHTFVRPIGAAMLAFTALASMDPILKLVLVLLCGGVAFSGHSSKAATRLIANHSPEPFTNIGLSILEDLLVPFGVWLSLEHPVLTLGLLAGFLVLFAWLSPKIFRLIRLQIAAMSALLRKHLRPAHSDLVDSLPAGYWEYLEMKGANPKKIHVCIRCAATRSIRGLRNSIGYVCLTENECFFITRRAFWFRIHKINPADLKQARFKRGILLDRLVLKTGLQEQTFYLFKDAANRGQNIAAALSTVAA